MLLSELKMTKKPLWTGATAVYPFSFKLADKFKFVSRYGDEIPLHTVVGDTIHLPRYLCPVADDDRRVDGEHVVYPVEPKPRAHQVPMFKKVRNLISEGTSGVICAYTGFGKTVLGYYAAYVSQRATLVITTKDDIYQQWIDGACGRVSPTNPDGMNFLGLDPSEVGEIRGDRCEIIGTKFCVAMIHSLSKDGKYDEAALKMLSDKFGLIIFDECHRVPADQFSNVVEMFAAAVRLGLSATPDRADGKETLLFAHIGPVVAQTEAQLMVPKVLRFKTGWECPRVMRMDEETGKRVPVRLPHEAGKTTHLEKIMAVDQTRNALIAELIHSAFVKGRKTVVFSTLHDHLEAIQKACYKGYKLGVKEIGLYIGATTKAERAARDKEKLKPIILTTYIMMGEGTSIDWLDTCILAMPRGKVEQPVGRVRREYPDKKQPVVMDLVDGDSPVFSGYAIGRNRWYESIGAEVKDME